MEVSIEVYEYLDQAAHKEENLAHEQRRHWDMRELDEYISANECSRSYILTPEQIVCRKETLAEIMSVLNACTDTQRERFLLYALEGMSFTEIGWHCGCSKGAVQSSVSWVEISDEVMEVILASIRKENAYNRQKYRYKEHFSLDVGDGIEHDALYVAPSPEEILLQKTAMEQLNQALSKLPDTQARRVHALHFGQEKIEIAKDEGVNDSGVGSSVQIGVRNLRRYFEQKKWLR